MSHPYSTSSLVFTLTTKSDSHPQMENLNSSQNPPIPQESEIQIGDDDFEFKVMSKDHDDLPDADEIFVDGMIRPLYLFSADWGQNGGVFRKEEEKVVRRIPLEKLIMMVEEDKEVYYFPSSDELYGIPTESYCVWTPGSSLSPDMKRKSKSTGNSCHRWRLRDLIVGRSLSDGKRFFFLSPSRNHQNHSSSSPSSGLKPSDEKKSTCRQLFNVRGGETAAAVDGDRKKWFVPYKKDLVGIFTSVGGTTRSFHPF